MKNEKCLNCIGACCKIVGVYLTKEEADILEKNNIDLTNKVEISDLDQFKYRIKKKEDGFCVFYQNDYGAHCSIYDIRPKVCENFSAERCRMKEIDEN